MDARDLNFGNVYFSPPLEHEHERRWKDVDVTTHSVRERAAALNREYYPHRYGTLTYKTSKLTKVTKSLLRPTTHN